MKPEILLYSLLFSGTFIFAQTDIFAQTEKFPCKTDEMHQELFQQHPEYNQGIRNAHLQLEADTRAFFHNGDQKSDAQYVIPVVFHIIHNYGPENISDAQIHDALKQVNLQFRKLNPDTNEIVAPFKPIAADIEVEFRLAQLDPDGNCTSGITRTVSSLTSPGNHDVKALIHWPPDKYLNVYVCSQAAGLAGHALLPSAADTIPQWDGIVMQHSYVGTIGTSEYFRRTVLSHEIGHFLNLQHIWGGNNVPDYYYLPVAQSGNCAYDDEVADTPNTIGWQSCNLSGNTCGELDNVQNYMDYAYCGRMFTEGQKARMHACLNSSVANRNKLWQPANLIATGTDDGTYYLCAAAFESDKQIACTGDTITFSDLSYHGIETRNWEFYGGTASSLSDSVVKVVYTNPGKYAVKLTAGRGSQSEEIIKKGYITILPDEGLSHFHRETFEDSTNAAYTIVHNLSPNDWQVNEVSGYQSQRSIFIDNYNGSPGIISDFILHPVNVSNLSSAVISFDVAYAQRTSSDNDLLQVYISTDCGKNWSIRRTLNGTGTLKTVTSPVTGDFTPTGNNEWKNQTATLNAASLTDDLLVRFSFKSAGGNNVYIDNIQISHPDELSIEKLHSDALVIYPNPSSESFTIYSSGEVLEQVLLFNPEGKLILEKNEINTNNFQLNTSDFSIGTYLISIQTDQGIYKHVQVISR